MTAALALGRRSYTTRRDAIAAALNVECLVYGFVRDPHGRINWEIELQSAADLLRAPPLAKQLGHHDTELLVGVQPPAVLTRSTCGSPTMSIEGPIPAPRDGIAPQLP